MAQGLRPKAQAKTRRVALTGGIATGKSHVRDQLERLGVPTIDADILARRAVEPGTPGFASVVARFGRQVLDESGALDRRTLGALVFSDPIARSDLEAIIHPVVRQHMDDFFRSHESKGHPFAVADIPLLYETGRQGDFDVVVVTACEPDAQIRRVIARDGLTDEEARRRVAAQLPIAEKVRRADFVIRTDGPVEDTNRQVRELWERLRQA
jgi:dephospho-CoA kinase